MWECVCGFRLRTSSKVRRTLAKCLNELIIQLISLLTIFAKKFAFCYEYGANGKARKHFHTWLYLSTYVLYLRMCIWTWSVAN